MPLATTVAWATTKTVSCIRFKELKAVTATNSTFTFNETRILPCAKIRKRKALTAINYTRKCDKMCFVYNKIISHLQQTNKPTEKYLYYGKCKSD